MGLADDNISSWSRLLKLRDVEWLIVGNLTVNPMSSCSLTWPSLAQAYSYMLSNPAMFVKGLPPVIYTCRGFIILNSMSC